MCWFLLRRKAKWRITARPLVRTEEPQRALQTPPLEPGLSRCSRSQQWPSSAFKVHLVDQSLSNAASAPFNNVTCTETVQQKQKQEGVGRNRSWCQGSTRWHLPGLFFNHCSSGLVFPFAAAPGLFLARPALTLGTHANSTTRLREHRPPVQGQDQEGGASHRIMLYRTIAMVNASIPLKTKPLSARRSRRKPVRFSSQSGSPSASSGAGSRKVKLSRVSTLHFNSTL